jgi:hypothetical protein
MSQKKSTILSLDEEFKPKRGAARGQQKRRAARGLKPCPPGASRVARAKSFDDGRVIELRYDGRYYAHHPEDSRGAAGRNPEAPHRARAASAFSAPSFAFEEKDPSVSYSVEDFDAPDYLRTDGVDELSAGGTDELRVEGTDDLSVSRQSSYDGGVRGDGAARDASESQGATPPWASALDAPSWNQSDDEGRAEDAEAFEADLRAIMTGQKQYEKDEDRRDPENKPSVALSTEGGDSPTAAHGGREEGAQHSHQIFDRLGQSMAFATTFDVGSVQLDTLFNDLDESVDKSLAKAAALPKARPNAPASSVAAPPPPSFQQSVYQPAAPVYEPPAYRPQASSLSAAGGVLSEYEVARDLSALGVVGAFGEAREPVPSAPAAAMATATAAPSYPIYRAPSVPPNVPQGVSRQASAPSLALANSSTVAAALPGIASFAARTGTSRWKLPRAEVAKRLEEVTRDPSLIAQGSLNLCGPAAFFYCWARRDPVSFVRYAIQLYEDGYGYIGDYKVTPGSDLVNQDYKAVVPRMKSLCPIAEWMFMSALRDEANAFNDFQGTPEEDVSGLTTPAELASWLTSTGVYRSVRDEGNWVFTKSLSHALALSPSPNTDVSLLIHAHVLANAAAGGKKKDSGLLQGFPNHFVVLESPIWQLPNGKVKFDCWTWGGKVGVEVDPKVFEANYYGAVIAEV